MACGLLDWSSRDIGYASFCEKVRFSGDFSGVLRWVEEGLKFGLSREFEGFSRVLGERRMEVDRRGLSMVFMSEETVSMLKEKSVRIPVLRLKEEEEWRYVAF